MKAAMVAMMALVFFGGAAGLSYVLWSDTEHETALAASEDNPAASHAGLPASQSDSTDVVGVRSRPGNPDQLFRMGVLLREQQQGLIRQREMLEEQQNRLKLVHQDMENHQRQLEGMYAQLADRVTAGEALLDKIRDERERLEVAKQQAEASQQELKKQSPDQNATTNVKQMSRWLQSMDANKAAETIHEMANDGQADLAVQLLSNMEDRNVAKVLSAMDDAVLRQELLMKMKELIRTAKRSSR